MFQVLNAVGDLLRNYLGLCTPFTRKRRNCPSSPPPAPSSGQAEARSRSAYTGLTGTGVVPTSTKVNVGLELGETFTIQSSKKRKAIQSKKAVKGKRSLSSGTGGSLSPSDAAAPRREGDTEKRMACGQWKGLLRNRPCTPAQRMDNTQR